MASPYGPQPIQRSNIPSGWQRALANFEEAFARTQQDELEREREEELYARGEPERERVRELHEATLHGRGYRRGTAPLGQETAREPADRDIGLGVEDFEQAFEEPDPMAVQLGMKRMTPPRRPKVVAPPGSFVPGLGFSREPVTEEDLARRDAQAQPPAEIGVRAPREFGREPAPTGAPPERMRARPEQITKDLYFDPSQSPEGRARSEREAQADELSAGLGELLGLPPEARVGLRRYLAAGGDPSDYLTYKRGIDTDRAAAPQRLQTSTGEWLERGPTGEYAPARGPGGKPIIGARPMQIITGEGGEQIRVPTQGAPGPIGVRRPPTEGELSREEKVRMNRALMADLEDAVDMVMQNPKAFGLRNAVGWIPKAGSSILASLDPGGVQARAAVQDVVGKLMHDRLGSAQSVGELMRAEGWAAAVTDPSDAIVKKLERLIERVNRETQALSGLVR